VSKEILFQIIYDEPLEKDLYKKCNDCDITSNYVSEFVERSKESMQIISDDIAYQLENKLLEKKTSYKSDSKAKQEITSIPKDVSITRVSLRKEPKKISREKEINNMLAEFDFCDMSRNIRGTFENDFVDNYDGTVTDKATGLMWQKGGSSKTLENRGAKKYIKQLNKKQFAGYSDWRMPTVEELASLIKKSKTKGIHLDSIFDNQQVSCWTVDMSEPRHFKNSEAWIVSFKHGEVRKAKWRNRMGTYQFILNEEHYVKAVRSVR